MNFTAHKEKDNNKMTSYMYGWIIRKVGMTFRV